MILNLHQLNSMGETLKLGYKFNSRQILFKKPFDLIIFLFHMKYERKITMRLVFTTLTKNCFAVKENE